jgi:hypothetical protein
MIGLETMVIVGAGEAESHCPELFTPRARTAVRFADPAAWIIATAVARAISARTELLAASLHDVGVVALSDHGPAPTMAEVCAAAKTGFSSPLRYAASSPGSLVGVSCIAFGFRGPTLNLTMRVEDGLPTALQMCSGWLTRRIARFMVFATFASDGSGNQLGRAVLLADPEITHAPAEPLTSSVTEWLSLVGK